MLSVSGLCPGLQASNNPGLFKIVSGCFGLPLGTYHLYIFERFTYHDQSLTMMSNFFFSNFARPHDDPCMWG
jgi:hypothetical protein